ncbi:MAG: DUF6463 family protein [Elainellaceae cyanobacterium]
MVKKQLSVAGVKMLQVSGYWLIAMSVLHVLVGGWIFAEPLMQIIRNGWFNTVAPNPFAPFYDREDAFWFLMLTPFLVSIGQLCFWSHANKIALPKFLGWMLLLTAIVGASLEPISACWLLIPPALLMLMAGNSKPITEESQV